MEKMTSTERNDLRSLIRQRARLMKTEIKQRRLELMSDFERQLSANFSYDQDEIWKDAHSIAEQAVKDAQVVIEERCRELKIPNVSSTTFKQAWRDVPRFGSKTVGGRSDRPLIRSKTVTVSCSREKDTKRIKSSAPSDGTWTKRRSWKKQCGNAHCEAVLDRGTN